MKMQAQPIAGGVTRFPPGRRKKRDLAVETPVGELFEPTLATQSLLPPLAGVLDSSAGKASASQNTNRAEIRATVRAEVAQALRDQGPVIISQVAPVVKREVLSDVTKLIQDEVATVCQRTATEAANEAIQHWIRSSKRQEELEIERRSVLLSGILGKNGQGSPVVSPSGSFKAKLKTRARVEEEPKRWTDLMREEGPTTSS